MLARSVSCAAPPRFGRPSRFRVVLSWRVPGALAFVMACAVSVGSLWASIDVCNPDYSKVDIAKVTTQKLVYEAFPQWQRRHAPDLPAMDELFVYMDSHDDLDPWGVPYTVEWTSHGLVAISRGEDRIPGTADDIRSDQ